MWTGSCPPAAPPQTSSWTPHYPSWQTAYKTHSIPKDCWFYCSFSWTLLCWCFWTLFRSAGLFSWTLCSICCSYCWCHSTVGILLLNSRCWSLGLCRIRSSTRGRISIGQSWRGWAGGRERATEATAGGWAWAGGWVAGRAPVSLGRWFAGQASPTRSYPAACCWCSPVLPVKSSVPCPSLASSQWQHWCGRS